MTIQNLFNAIRDWEDDNLDVDTIVEGYGKQDLGGGVLVGITVKLFNWRVKFADRPGPAWIICAISGGNLVAVDGVGASMNPVAPATFVTVTLTSSSSATLSDIEAIQYASYNGGSTIDEINGTDSSEYPYGTPAYPCKTVENVYTINVSKGFSKCYVRGNLTASDYPAEYIFDTTIIGEYGRQSTLVTVTNSVVTNCRFENLRLQGTFVDSIIRAKDCDLLDISGVIIQASDCYLKGEIQLNDSESSNFNNCNDGIPGSGTPIINVGNCLAVGFWGYAGGLKITNMTLATDVSLNLNPGRVVLDVSCTAGSVIVRGIGTLVNNAVGPTVNQIGLLDLNYISHAIWDEPVAEHAVADTFGANLTLIKKLQSNRWKIVGNQMIIYEDNGVDALLTLDLKNAVGDPSMTEVYERVPV